jgi:potassium-transporting ATPase KdpC subunit
MFTEFRASIRPAFALLLLLAVITGLAFPALITGVANLSMPGKAEGSLIHDRGQIVGSALLAQGFSRPEYFHPRPSAAGKGYDASASAATNFAPSSKDLRNAIADRVALARAEGVTSQSLPSDMVTASASGLDPDISPEAALLQVPRVAKARGLNEGRVRALLDSEITYPLFGIVGEPHVNILLLNRQLDQNATMMR